MEEEDDARSNRSLSPDCAFVDIDDTDPKKPDTDCLDIDAADETGDSGRGVNDDASVPTLVRRGDFISACNC